jgi:spore coat protein CotH
MVAAQALNQPALDQMYDTLNKVMDVDRALWFIAHEIMFGDDDGYINKGGMDYYVYFDKETNRLVPLEYDGNSVMSTMAASWSIFNKETDTKFPLSSRLTKNA